MKRSEMIQILGQAILEAIPSDIIGDINIDVNPIVNANISVDTDHILKVIEEIMLPPCSKKGFYKWENEDDNR